MLKVEQGITCFQCHDGTLRRATLANILADARLLRREAERIHANNGHAVVVLDQLLYVSLCCSHVDVKGVLIELDAIYRGICNHIAFY